MSQLQQNRIMPTELIDRIIPERCRPTLDVTTVLHTRYWVGAEDDSPPADYWPARAELFLRWCLPSVAAQRRPPDAWIILVSPWALALISSEVLDAIAEVPFAHIVEVPDGQSFSAVARRWTEANLRPKTWILTARTDSDDAIAEDYLDALTAWVSRAKPPAPATLIFPFGLQHMLDQTTQQYGQTWIDMHSVCHFPAVVTRRDEDGYDPWDSAHPQVYADGKTVHQLITTDPMWCEVLHERNAVNTYRGGPAWDEADLTRFAQESRQRP